MENEIHIGKTIANGERSKFAIMFLFWPFWWFGFYMDTNSTIIQIGPIGFAFSFSEERVRTKMMIEKLKSKKINESDNIHSKR